MEEEEEEEETGLTGSHQTGFGASRARDLVADLRGIFPRRISSAVGDGRREGRGAGRGEVGEW